VNHGSVRERVALVDHTSLRVGGPARYYARPENREALVGALRWAREHDVPVAVLGGGTNLLFSDAGYPGLVLHTTGLRESNIRGERIEASAGASLSALAWRACRGGLSGMEWACGIPGTVGGAVVMNAGTRDGALGDCLVRAEVVCAAEGGGTGVDGAAEGGVEGGAGAPRPYSVDELHLGYRTSAILRGGIRGVVARAEFRLKHESADVCTARAREILAGRMERLPSGASVGCIFRNPPTGPPAGELLDRAGCKGMREGDVYVSDRHANVLINGGSGSAGDVLRLIDRMKRTVRDRFGVELEEEVVIVPPTA